MPALFTSRSIGPRADSAAAIEGLDRIGLRDVEEMDEGAAARGLDTSAATSREPFHPPRAERDAEALPRQLDRGGRADPGRGARHDRRARLPLMLANRIGSAAKPRTLTEWTRTLPDGSTSQSGSRRSTSSSATRPSRRASEAPRQKCVP